MSVSLPILEPEATPIGRTGFSVRFAEDTVTYFSNLAPMDYHAADERAAMLMRIGRFVVVSGIPQQDVMVAFGVSRSTVRRAVRRFRQGGEKTFQVPRRGRGPSKFTPELAERATALLQDGLSGVAVARALGVSVASVNKWRRQGLIGAAAQEAGSTADTRRAETDRTARDERDRRAPMGRAACNVPERVSASLG